MTLHRKSLDLETQVFCALSSETPRSKSSDVIKSGITTEVRKVKGDIGRSVC